MRLNKVVRIGVGPYGSVFCRITFQGGSLSITGVEGPMRNGDAKGSSGQIVMSPWEVEEYAPGWNSEKEKQFREVWERWHLNDLKAGSAVQEAYLREHPIQFKYPETHYGKACSVLSEAGLNPDSDGYRYGSDWKFEEIPAEVIEWLAGLPDTDVTPTWV